jgi:hypothetical protein
MGTNISEKPAALKLRLEELFSGNGREENTSTWKI